MLGREVSRDAIAALREEGLIAAGPRSPTPGAPYAYVTTPGFLGEFGFESLRDLPDIAPGFQMLAGRVIPSHAYVHVVDFGRPVDVAGMRVRDGDLVAVRSRSGEIALRAVITERVQPGVVYTTFHHPMTGANVVTTEFSDWATNCPEYKVTAVQVRRTNGPSVWQQQFEDESRTMRRVEVLEAAE